MKISSFEVVLTNPVPTLLQRYDAILSEMNAMMEKAAESNALFAEQNFESKQRDFLRFLERVRKIGESRSRTTRTERQLLLEQVLSMADGTKLWYHKPRQ